MALIRLIQLILSCIADSACSASCISAWVVIGMGIFSQDLAGERSPEAELEVELMLELLEYELLLVLGMATNGHLARHCSSLTLSP